VLIVGDSGTGKELVARTIHQRSGRSGPFLSVNCAALPEAVLEGELFGYEPGAAPGAAAGRPGLFEEAQGGTLFLDEVGELPLGAQVKLNRALQEHEVRRVGDNTPVKVDARVLAATHRDLKAEVASGRFREDLFYRLHVYPVRLPPLRERRDDVPLLAAHFLDKHSRAHGRELTGFELDALRALTTYAWPGNVRELENAVERAVVVAPPPLVRLVDLPAEVREAPAASLPPEVLVRMPYKQAVDLAREQVSREYLTALLREFGGNVTHAAERAGVERESLHRLLKRYGVRSDDFKQG
jgi:two-component system response regulator AtoC